MRVLAFLATAIVLTGGPSSAGTLSGLWKNPASHETATSTLDVKSDSAIDYCITTSQQSCWEMEVDRQYKNGALEVRQDAKHTNSDGSVIEFEHIWTYTPVNGGYDGNYEIQVSGKAREFRASAKYR